MIRSRFMKLLLVAALFATVAPIGCSGGASCSAKTQAPAAATP